MVFYAWSIPLAVVLVLSLIAINFGLGEAIEKRTGDARYSVIVVGIGLNLLVLISFKYADFLLENLNALLGLVSDWRVPLPHIALPLGISFFTFHIISYLVDVYRGSVHAQKSRVAFTLYIINFPQLIAGPIIRYHQISDQLQQRTVRFADVDSGVGRFTIGCGGRPDLHRFARSAHQRDSLARRAVLWLANLFRLLRLFRHGDRNRQNLWFPVSGKFQLPLFCHVNPGFLAALAHNTVLVVSRLRVHSARRKSSWAVEDRP